MEDIHNRILSIIKNKLLNAGQFADEIGVQRSSISHILSGRNKPSIDFLQKLLNRYKDIDIHWLLTGTIQSKLSSIVQNETKDAQLHVVKSDVFNEQASLFDNENLNKPLQQNKKIEKIVTFYSNKTFTEYFPE